MKKDLKVNVGLAYTNKRMTRGSEVKSMGNLMYWIMLAIQKLTPFKSPKLWLDKYKIKGKYEPTKDLAGWYQTKEIGCMPDPEDAEGREVL